MGRVHPVLVGLTGALLASIHANVAVATPGEARQLRVTGFDRDTGELSLSYEPACGVLDHHIEFGPLAEVAAPGYSGQECGIGVSGSHDGFAPGSGSYFFVVVGNDGEGTEGSYGTGLIDGAAVERAEDLLDPVCVFVQDLSDRCDAPVVPVLELTAFRPQSEAYGAPFDRRALAEDEELEPGAGIRINGDDDDGNGTPDLEDTSVAGENDLIEVLLTALPPVPREGQQYVLRRSSAGIRVWVQSEKGTELFGGSDSVFLDFDDGPLTLWIEKPDEGEALLQLVAESSSDGSPIAMDELRLFAFTSVIVALGGEGQVPADPPLDPGNHGTFQIAIDLYEQGYDVHMYDEDVVQPSGAGAAFDEVASAVRDRGVVGVAIFGYSHGGGSTNDLARRLDENRATIGTFSIDFTGYVDGIDNDSDFDTDTEDELPPSTGYHANYYEGYPCGPFALCGGPIAGADFDLDVNDTPWGATLRHFTIDDAPEVIQGIRDPLTERVAR